MAFDFPASPSVGDLYPVTPVAGSPQYRWNGSAWIAVDIPTPPNPGIPSGTTMLFYQAAAPTGWTKLTAHNDKALRVVSGAGGVAGGSNAFSTVMAQSVVGNTTLPLGGLPTGISMSGSATVYAGGNVNNAVPISLNGTWASAPTISTGTYYAAYAPNTSISYANAFTGAASGTSNNTGGGAHNHPITMAIQYLDMILASKD